MELCRLGRNSPDRFRHTEHRRFRAPRQHADYRFSGSQLPDFAAAPSTARFTSQEGENPPVGLILCSEPDDALAKYALEKLPNKVLAREYRLALPEEKALAAEIERIRQRLQRGRP